MRDFLADRAGSRQIGRSPPRLQLRRPPLAVGDRRRIGGGIGMDMGLGDEALTQKGEQHGEGDDEPARARERRRFRASPFRT